MKTNQWDKDIEESIRHRTVADIIEEYHKREEERREERELADLIEERRKKGKSPFLSYRESKEK